MTFRVLLSLCVLSVTVWARPYSGEDDDAFANLIEEIEAEGQAEGLSDADLEDLESDLEDEEYTEMRIMGIEDEDMGIGGESIESIDEIKKITPIKRIQKVKKIQEVKDIQEVPEHVARKFLEDHYEGEGNEGPPTGSEGEDGGPPIDIDPIGPNAIDYPDPEETMMEVSVAEIANVRMLLEEALDALPLTEGFNPETEPGPDYPGPDYPGPDYPEPELPGIKNIQGLKKVTPLKSVQEITKMDEVVGLYELTDEQAERLREINERKKGRKGKKNKYGGYGRR